MEIRTHHKIDPELCGNPLAVDAGFSRVELTATERMAVDTSGLVHGGFIFGLADYAAMIAVNEPFVVLGGAEVKFLKPIRVGDIVTAEATVTERKGKKHTVSVTADRDREPVFSGVFICFVLEKHVLE